MVPVHICTLTGVISVIHTARQYKMLASPSSRYAHAMNDRLAITGLSHAMHMHAHIHAHHTMFPHL